MNEKHIGRNLKIIMEHLELKQSDLADKTGLTQAAISQIINGERIPSVESLIKILKVIPITFEKLCK